MEYFKPISKPLLLVLLLFWMVCFGLALYSALNHIGYPPVIIKASAEADGFPTVVGIISPSLEKKSALRVGDKLIRFGEVDLRGAGPVDFITHVAEETAAGPRVQVVFEQNGEQRVETLVVGSYATYLPRLPASIAFVITALILAFRAEPSKMVHTFLWSHFCAAFFFSSTFAGNWMVTYISMAAHVTSLTLGAPMAIRSVLLFPHGKPPKGWWARITPWFFAIIGPLDASRIYLFPFSSKVGTSGIHLVSVIFIITVLIIITGTYRRSDPIGRRRLKWYLFGIYCAFSLPMAVGLAAIINPIFTQLVVISSGTLVFIPISHIISIMRYNFFDIDRIINVTASYTLFSIILLAALLTAVPILAHALSKPMSVGPGTMQVVLSLILAAVAISLINRLHPLINQIFFAERQAFEAGIGRLLRFLTECPSADQLIMQAGEQLEELLRPESCAIYARGSKIFSPVLAHGRAVPPAFESGSPLIATLGKSSATLSAELLSNRRNSAMMSPLDQAALETLGMPVLVPIRRANDLVAFICLGPKRSGDVYTSTELALLRTVAEKVSSQLLSFDQTEIIRQSHAMREALRRYVPEAVADQLESGHDLEVGECEVTVLFVDIRGYSSFAEKSKVADVFSTVNRYTKTVSEIVREHGGNVIEFNGDGLMAVFGAPQRLENKERSAVEAARRIIPAVGLLNLGEEGTRNSVLSVGVGIATGEAFVGSVQSADRLIWTAIGTTANLAARFQDLTRPMEASIVIDSTTRNHTGDIANDFIKKENTPIRGLSRTMDLYALPYL